MSAQHTPLMQQYFEIKSQYPNMLLFFQVGDFYEFFFDDAKIAASFLGITLTARGKTKGDPIPLCGVPVHAKDHYVYKLVKGGYNVALCDQLTPARPGLMVERGVTQVLTPGTLTDERLLDAKTASYIFACYPGQQMWGLVFAELMTAQLYATIIPAQHEKKLEAELVRFFPDEILLPENVGQKKDYDLVHAFLKKQGYFTTNVVQEPELEVLSEQWIETQFNPKTVAVVHEHDAIRHALNCFFAYMSKNQKEALTQFNHISVYEPEQFLILDAATQRNLELTKNIQDGSSKNTLFSVIDRACTSMGSRLIKKWLLRPLVASDPIVQRQEVIVKLCTQTQQAHALASHVRAIGDIERAIGRIALGRAPIGDYGALRDALAYLPELKELLASWHEPLVSVIYNQLGDFHRLHQVLKAAINDDSTQDWCIKKGFDSSLDNLRDLVAHGNAKIHELERKEQERTRISSLKIRYNQLHGYAIEITKSNLNFVPDYFIKKQALVGKTRFTTQELEELQTHIIHARAEIETVEKEVFSRVKLEVREYISQLRKAAYALANLDALLGLSFVAFDNNFTRPVFNTERIHEIQAGRHPVVESHMRVRFIPNNALFDDTQSLWIVTGPNMGGKSTFLRQIALIQLLAQIGSFVPASFANLALCDRVFTRIGAGDNVAEGKSTFLVEMEEVATICTHATDKSLVILDEVGRGTSTYDGLAIAHAVVEYLYTQVKARCLFATHYHELTQLEAEYPGIVSYYAASEKKSYGILFLYTMVRGVADGSFGIEVAQLAQVPPAIIARSRELLTQLKSEGPQLFQRSTSVAIEPVFDVQADKLKEMLSDMQLDDLSPRQAWEFLEKLKGFIER